MGDGRGGGGGRHETQARPARGLRARGGSRRREGKAVVLRQHRPGEGAGGRGHGPIHRCPHEPGKVRRQGGLGLVRDLLRRRPGPALGQSEDGEQPALVAGHPEAAGRLHHDRTAGAEAQQEEEAVHGACRLLPLPLEGTDDALVDLGILPSLDDGPEAPEQQVLAGGQAQQVAGKGHGPGRIAMRSDNANELQLHLQRG
ncbi:MAG: hypothetical protein DI532_06545 [Azospirillum brasilense]|nr:MAG: hypothetical protein DI532_06545 [Azospirillum brasilense]